MGFVDNIIKFITVIFLNWFTCGVNAVPTIFLFLNVNRKEMVLRKSGNYNIELKKSMTI